MYAGFWKRVVAYIIDLIVIGIVWSLFMFLLNALHLSLVCSAIIFIILWFLYFVYPEASSWQATLGKRIVGIKVVDMHGYRISIVRSAGRNVSMGLSIWTFYIGFLMCLWTKREQCLHDMTSGCLVVTEDVQPTPEFPPTKPPFIMWICLVIIPIIWLAFMSLPFKMERSLKKGEFSPEKQVLAKRLKTINTSIPTSFKQAIQEGDVKNITYYLQKGEDPNQKTDQGIPLLFFAKDANTLSLLLQAGANPNAKDAKGITVLMKAVNDENFEKVDLLLNKGADVNASTQEYGTTPLMYTCMHSSVDRNSYQYMKPKLLQTARIAERLIQAGAKVNTVDSNRRTALRWCSFSGNDQVVRVLMRSRASSDIVDKDGNTPLIIAATYNSIEVAAALITGGVPLDTQNDKGDTALIKAAFFGNTEIVRMLLDNGANPGIKNKKGDTAIMWAGIEGHKDIVNLLIQAGEKPLW